MASNKNDAKADLRTDTRRKILDFIEQSEKRGLFDDQIRKQLYSSGYSPDDIEGYIKAAHEELQGVKKENIDHIITKKMIVILLITSLIFNVVLITLIQFTGSGSSSADLSSGDSSIYATDVAEADVIGNVADKYSDLGLSEADSRELRRCINVNRMDCESKTFKETAISTNDRSLCELIPKKAEKDSCLIEYQLQLALINNDVNLCNQLLKEQSVACKDSYFFEKSKSSGADFCSQIADKALKNKCTEEVAVR